MPKSSATRSPAKAAASRSAKRNGRSARNGGAAAAAKKENAIVASSTGPRWHHLTVIARDPSVKVKPNRGLAPEILTADLQVPLDYLEPGPRSHRFHVVDYNSTTGVASPPFDLSYYARGTLPYGWWPAFTFTRPSPDLRDGWPLPIPTDKQLTEDRRFFAQNVYATAAKTLALFESTLGRRIGWNFDSHQIYLIPDAFEKANAYYSPEHRGVVFGYFGKGAGLTHTCLSYDIIAHETTHAILDGLRPHLLEPGLPDQVAYHEALADIVATLSIFQIEATVTALLKAKRPNLKKLRSATTAPAYAKQLARSTIFLLAQEFGKRLDPHAKSLRNSIELKPEEVPADFKTSDDWQEPHRRGEILVAAVMQTVAEIWANRIVRLVPKQPTVALLAREGAKSAQHLLGMVIRGIDYCPPVEPEFDDVLDAILLADESLVTDDDHDYRKTMRDNFGRFGIRRPERKTVTVNKNPPIMTTLNFSEFAVDADEVWKFLWQSGDRLNMDMHTFHTRVCDVQPSMRIGPDGFVFRETVVCYIQSLDGTLGELVEFSKRYIAPDTKKVSKPALVVPDGMTEKTQVRLWGGGVILFNQFGQPRQSVYKPIWEWSRQSLRLRRLADGGEVGEGDRFGFDTGRLTTSQMFHAQEED